MSNNHLPPNPRNAHRCPSKMFYLLVLALWIRDDSPIEWRRDVATYELVSSRSLSDPGEK